MGMRLELSAKIVEMAMGSVLDLDTKIPYQN